MFSNFAVKYSVLTRYVKTHVRHTYASLSRHEVVCSAEMFMPCAVTVIIFVHVSICVSGCNILSMGFGRIFSVIYNFNFMHQTKFQGR